VTGFLRIVVVALAERGWKRALAEDRHLRAGLDIHDGLETLKPVVDAHGLDSVAAEKVAGLAD
jgi:alanine dehydrogenase